MSRSFCIHVFFVFAALIKCIMTLTHTLSPRYHTHPQAHYDYQLEEDLKRATPLSSIEELETYRNTSVVVLLDLQSPWVIALMLDVWVFFLWPGHHHTLRSHCCQLSLIPYDPLGSTVELVCGAIF